MFTLELIEEIHRKLQLFGVKDMDLPTLTEQLDGSEVLTLIKNGRNIQLMVSQFLNFDMFTPELLESLRGPQGLDGKNAYQTWLEQGNVGTYDDYLTILQLPALTASETLTIIVNNKLDEADNVIIRLNDKNAEMQLVISEATIAKDLALEVVTHPPAIVNGYWHLWNHVTNQYDTTYVKAAGDTAYEIWLAEGNTGTKEDFLEWFQSPANEAIASIQEAENIALYNETLRETAEDLRVTAETNRNNAEGLRLSAEVIRNENEADRIEAEGLRAGAETGRQTAEGLRVTAEQARQTNTATAIQNAENATTGANNAAGLANEKAGLANNAAILANEKAGLADTAATNANTKAGLADAAATNANNVANTYAAELAGKVKTSDLATQAEAEANSNNTKWMTPLRVFQNWAYNVGNYVNSTLTTVSKTIIGAINELKGQTPAATTLQTVTDKNQFYPIVQNNAGAILGRHIVKYWNGSSWVIASTVALGDGAAQNATSSLGVAIGYQAGTSMTANGVAIGYQAGTSIGDQIAIGYRAMNNFTGAYSTAVGYESAKIGTNAHYTTAFGSYSQSNNCAGLSCSFGSSSLTNNTGAYSNGIGYKSLENNTGNNSNGFGFSSLQNNTGAISNGFGQNTLKYNQKDNNTAIGDNSYSGFLANIAGNKTADSSAVDITLERITLTAHGFGAVNAVVNIKYASTDGTAIGGLTVGNIYQVKIIDANTVEFITGSLKINLTSQGTGNHTFTPQFAYANTTCLGANTQPNKDNQVVLGSTAVDTVKMGGTARTIASATATGEKGEMCWDANYIYICVATNTWKRIALSTW